MVFIVISTVYKRYLGAITYLRTLLYFKSFYVVRNLPIEGPIFMTKKTIELISFDLCPFVQRSVITLKKKNIDFNITYIDLANKPDWFLKISPLGKVPVLRYGDDVIFESAIINEFLDEITGDALMPSEPLAKAKQRGWIEYASQVLMDQYLVSASAKAEDFEKHSANLNQKLARLEIEVSDQGYFNDGSFSLIDSAIAPLFTRMDILAKRFNQNFLQGFPKLVALSKKLLEKDYVSDSVISNFEDVYVNYLKTNKTFIASQT